VGVRVAVGRGVFVGGGGVVAVAVFAGGEVFVAVGGGPEVCVAVAGGLDVFVAVGLVVDVEVGGSCVAVFVEVAVVAGPCVASVSAGLVGASRVSVGVFWSLVAVGSLCSVAFCASGGISTMRPSQAARKSTSPKAAN
jgi:hypothetical protein